MLNRLGMSDTRVYLTEEQEIRRAVPHTVQGDAVNPRAINDTWLAAGYLNSTAYDMTKYIMANLGQTAADNRQLQSAVLLAQSRHRSAVDADGTENIMGLGWNYGRNIYGTNNPVIYHSGAITGYVSTLVLSHHLDAGIVVLSNHYREGGDTIVNPYALAILLLNVVGDVSP